MSLPGPDRQIIAARKNPPLPGQLRTSAGSQGGGHRADFERERERCEGPDGSPRSGGPIAGELASFQARPWLAPHSLTKQRRAYARRPGGTVAASGAGEPQRCHGALLVCEAGRATMRTILLLLLFGALCSCATGPASPPQSVDARALCQQQAQASASVPEQKDAYFDQCMVASGQRPK
jgi:hypothetical protein